MTMTKWKINSIKIENFKFFHRPFKMDIEGKNLLLYGENGSGKSSLYWAIYTLFQSSYKRPTIDDAQKYFVADNTENLRNKFLPDTQRSGIDLEFISEDDGRRKSYEDSNVRCNTSTDPFMSITAGSSTFMNYKFLSAIFDFKNSKQPEIFNIFVSDIFPALILQPSMKLIHYDGTQSSVMTADYWWKYLNNNLQNLKRGSNPHYILKTSDEYIRYSRLLKEFNRQIKNNVTLIETKANQMISNSFKLNARLQMDYENARITDVQMGPGVLYNKKILPPKIKVKAEFSHNHIVGHNDILHPRSFFNEAKLTCLAIAMRFAVVEIMHRAEDDGASALFLDDLLISLDMSTRLEVMDIILSYESNYQILLFTHDYTFFDILRSKIRQQKHDSSWLFKELYSLNDDIDNIPDYLLVDNQNAIDRAKAFYEQRDYAASANALRRECEEQLKRLLPFNATVEFQRAPFPKTSPKQLSNMMGALNQFYSDTGIPDITPDIQMYRERILNPLSHHDARTPIYKSELLKAIDEISKLRTISVSFLVQYADCTLSNEFFIHFTKDGIDAEVHFYFCAEWVKYTLNGMDYFSNPLLHITSSNVPQYVVGREKTIKSIYNTLCNYVYRGSGGYPSLEDAIQK